MMLTLNDSKPMSPKNVNEELPSTSDGLANKRILKPSKSPPKSPEKKEKENSERCCWICFTTDAENLSATWVQPCKCKGSAKWVHQKCIYRWIDEKQQGNSSRSVFCQQCQTEYILVFPRVGKLARMLEAADIMVTRACPFLTGGIIFGSIYWTSVTYGAVTFMQVLGQQKGMHILQKGNALVLLVGLPSISVTLILGRMIQWEKALVPLARYCRTFMRKVPVMNLLVSAPDEFEELEELEESAEPVQPILVAPLFSNPLAASRLFCGALLLPTFSRIVGRMLFDSVENSVHRTIMGGITFITVKGIFKMYMHSEQARRKKRRHILDYTEENLEFYVNEPNDDDSFDDDLESLSSSDGSDIYTEDEEYENF